MIDKSKSSLSEVLSQIKDGATILIGGFGTAGQPAELIDGLIELGVKDLTIVSNNAGNGDYGLANEPYRVCRRVNILRDYPDDKTKLYPRN